MRQCYYVRDPYYFFMTSHGISGRTVETMLGVFVLRGLMIATDVFRKYGRFRRSSPWLCY